MIRNVFILLSHVFILVYLIAEYFYAPRQLDTFFLSKILIAVLVGIVGFMASKEPVGQLRRQYVRISWLFLLGFVIVHFQIYLDYIIGNYSSFGMELMINKSVVSKASTISAIALLIYFIGYQVAVIRQVGLGYIKNQSAVSTINSTKGVLGLIVISFSIMVGTADWKYYNGGYGDMSIGTVAGYAEQFLIISILAYLVLFVRNARIRGMVIPGMVQFVRRLGIWFNGIVFLYLILVMFSGDRGPIIQIGMAIIGAYALLAVRKIRLPLIIGGVVVAATFISVLAFVREMDGQGDFLEKTSRAQELRSRSSLQQSVSPSTLELAVSVRTMHAAVDYVEKKDHTYGFFQIFQGLAIIPGLGTIVKAAVGLENTDIRSSGFLTQHINGKNFDHGLGTTVVADIYLDFGLIGVMVGFFVFAIFVRYVEVSAYAGNWFKMSTLILFFIFLPQAIYIGRSTILILFKDALLLYVFVMLGFIINSLLGVKKKQVA